MSFASNAIQLAKRLINKYGNDVVLKIVIAPTYDPITGDLSGVNIVTPTKGVVTNFTIAQQASDNYTVGDMLVIIQHDELVNRDSLVDLGGKEWKVIDTYDVTTQNLLIIQKLHIRGI